jgi:quinol monooxygenase YgiN
MPPSWLVLAISRYRVTADDAPEFLALARPALEVLAEQPGFVAGEVGRALDDGALFVLSTRWESVGAYRRALSAYDVKVHAVPLMYRAIDEPSAFEPVLASVDGGIAAYRSDRSADAESAGPTPRADR